MNSWVLTAIIVAVLLWCIVRTGPRRAERTLRLLARDSGGRFLNGGIATRNVAVIPTSRGTIHVTLRCRSWFGTRYSAEFRAPWGPGRPSVAWAEPTRLVFSAPIQSSAPLQPKGSDQLREVARRLQSSAGIEQEWVWVEAAGDHFFSQAVLTTADIAPVTDWFATTARLYDLMVAETEAGIEFSLARPGSGVGEASCQVCGVPPAASETIYCERCGAPHHADCWDYNRGCAIYGCKK